MQNHRARRQHAPARYLYQNYFKDTKTVRYLCFLIDFVGAPPKDGKGFRDFYRNRTNSIFFQLIVATLVIGISVNLLLLHSKISRQERFGRRQGADSGHNSIN